MADLLYHAMVLLNLQVLYECMASYKPASTYRFSDGWLCHKFQDDLCAIVSQHKCCPACSIFIVCSSSLEQRDFSGVCPNRWNHEPSSCLGLDLHSSEHFMYTLFYFGRETWPCFLALGLDIKDVVQGVTYKDVGKVLRSRFGTSGIEEKAARSWKPEIAIHLTHACFWPRISSLYCKQMLKRRLNDCWMNQDIWFPNFSSLVETHRLWSWSTVLLSFWYT